MRKSLCVVAIDFLKKVSTLKPQLSPDYGLIIIEILILIPYKSLYLIKGPGSDLLKFRSPLCDTSYLIIIYNLLYVGGLNLMLIFIPLTVYLKEKEIKRGSIVCCRHSSWVSKQHNNDFFE